jgi:hypothetical protein
MGAKYYAKIKALYQTEDSPMKLLKVTDDTLVIGTQLLKAIVSAKAKQPNRQPMLGYLNTADKPNQKELVGILRWGLDLKPSSSAEQLRCCLDLMRYVARLQLDKAFPTEIGIMHSHFDDSLVQALFTRLCMRCNPPQTDIVPSMSNPRLCVHACNNACLR